MFRHHPWIAQLESDPEHTRHARLSLLVLELIAVKIYQIAKFGITGLHSVMILL